MKRIYIYLLITVIIAAGGAYYWFSSSGSKEIKYRTEKVARGNVVLQVRATGTINPLLTVRVGSQVSGTIAKLYVDFNDDVRKGQIIAQIDSTFLNAAVKEAQANLERNQAQVNEAKRSYDRTKELFKKDLVSQADLDAAQTGFETSVAQSKQTQAALDRAMVNLRYSIIRAPIDGVIVSRDVDVGQTVAASLQAPQLFSIANDLARMQVEASVDEADIGQIKTGQAVTFTVDSYPDEEFSGKVTQVRLAPVTVQSVVTYTVIIEVDNPDLKLRPGMTATVSILIDKREDIVRVPALALRFQPSEDVLKEMQQTKPEGSSMATAAEQAPGQGKQPEEKTRMMRRSEGGGNEPGGRRPMGDAANRKSMGRVWIMIGKKLKQVSIRTGLNDSRFIEIVGGELKEGDEIILGATGPESAGGPPGQSNPFQQRMGGPGGGRRGF